jgi:hypothetical protein
MAPPKFTDRFAISVDGIEGDTVSNLWRGFCKLNGSPPSEAFKNVYTHFTTVRGSEFHFRSGDREGIRGDVEALFKKVSPKVKARIVA